MAEIEKPTIVAKREFMEELKNLINNAGLPAFILRPIFTEFTNQIAEIEEQQYLAEKANYEKRLAEQAGKEKADE